jgi:hypothetical protein
MFQINWRNADQLASQTPSSSASTAGAVTQIGSGGSDQGQVSLAVGAIVGIVVGVVAAAIIIGFCVLLLCRRRRARKKSPTESPFVPYSSGEVTETIRDTHLPKELHGSHIERTELPGDDLIPETPIEAPVQAPSRSR